MISPPYTRIFRWFFRTSAHGKPRPPHQTATRSGRQPFAAGRQRVAKAPRSRGNPFLPAYAGQKFLPPGILLGTKLSAEPRTRRKAARTLSALNFPVCVPSIRTCRLDGTFLTVLRPAAFRCRPGKTSFSRSKKNTETHENT